VTTAPALSPRFVRGYAHSMAVNAASRRGPSDPGEAERLDVAIVGAGASGLAAAAALRRRGLDPVAFDGDERIGGTWARRYDRLCLHTARAFSGLPYHRLPRQLPRYVPKDDYADYLAAYAARLGLRLRLGHRVERIVPADGGPDWRLEMAGTTCRARAVVVATGKYRVPRTPRWPGVDAFQGTVLHSSAYRRGHAFAGRRALVVGMGNSGAEIAVDLVEGGAARVAIAVRTPPPIVLRDMLGVPIQVLGILLTPLPPTPVDRVGALLRRLSVGDLRAHGLAPAAWGPFTARRPPVIDVGFLAQLRAGRIAVRPAVVRFTADGVTFADGQREPFDVVVAATGFASGLDQLLGTTGVLDERALPRCGPDGDSARPGLFFIGFHESPRGALFEANRQARRLARRVADYLADSP
jgi:putative flavoprotein involved in K+ transport